MKLTFAFIFATLVWVNFHTNVNANDNARATALGENHVSGDRRWLKNNKSSKATSFSKKSKRTKKSKKAKKAKKGNNSQPTSSPTESTLLGVGDSTSSPFSVEARIAVSQGTPEEKIVETLEKVFVELMNLNFYPDILQLVTVILLARKCEGWGFVLPKNWSCWNFEVQGQTANEFRTNVRFYEDIKNGYTTQFVRRNGLPDAVVENI